MRMRSRSRRRSVSSCVSPGPRRPIPPFWRSRWVQPRTRRVDMWRSCASSTCSLPTCERARCAKMSRISPVRSITRQPSARSRLRSCEGLSAWLKMTSAASCALTAASISASLPVPTKCLGSGRSRWPKTNGHRIAARGQHQLLELARDLPAHRRPPVRGERAPPAHRSPGVRRTPYSAASSPSFGEARRTGREGTTVDTACL